MAPRIRMQILAAGEDDTTTPDGDAEPVSTGPGRFHALIIVEDTETGDDRLFVEGSLTWRTLPLPLMAKDTDEHGSMGADTKSTLVGNFDKIERQGTEIHGWGQYVTAEPGTEAARLIGLIERGELRGISADIDAVEYDVLFPVEPEPEEADGDLDGDDENVAADSDPVGLPRETDGDGNTYEVMRLVNPKLRVTEGRVMGATVVPFPALQEAYIEPDGSMVASAATVFAHHGVTGVIIASAGLAARETHPDRFTFPVLPPVAWFEVPEAPGPMPLTIMDDGQVFGHLATWGECHVGIAGECVEPPRSATNYARFHVGEVPCADGERVSTGRLTFRTGHADTRLGPDATRAHYDDTGTVAADIVAVDGEFGIWVCGAARPDLTAAQVREVMASPPSGDWRRFGRSLELVGALCVNVPGFNTPRQLNAAGDPVTVAAEDWARVRQEDGIVASLIVSRPAHPGALAPGTDHGLDPVVAARIRDRIAASIGRDRKTRAAALAARVHGGRS